MRRFLLASALLLIVTAAIAVPARRGLWKTIRLVDGSEIRAELRGDEFGHFWQAADGRTFIKTAGGENYEETSLASLVEEMKAKREAVEQVQQTRLKGQKRITLGGEHDPYEGKKKCLIILADFPDSKFKDGHNLDLYKRMANEENFNDGEGNVHSVHDFFYDQSYGNLDIEFDVVGPVTMSYGYAHYGGSMNYVYQMVTECCRSAEEQGIDFSQYDWDGDGEVDEVFILYAGYNSASYFEDEDLIWPHMGYLNNHAVTYDGVKIDTYACSSELSAEGRNNGIGAMCHEFSHCLGLPDAYDTTYSTDWFCMSFWSIMDSGCYNGDDAGYLPAGYTSYERMYCGWLTPIELTEETEVTGMKGLTEGGEAYIIYNKGYQKEYYMLENRSAYDYDAGLYGNGLLVLHVDFNSTFWAANSVNSPNYGNNHQRYAIIAADNDYSISASSLAGDVYPSSGNNHFDNSSSPAADTYNLNTDGTQKMNISITNITKADDGTISFRFYPAGADPTHGNEPDGAVFYESFDYCSGAGGNDGNFGGTGIGAGTFNPDNSDWTYNSAHGALQCAMFGSNTQAANVVTPTFAIDGETVFSFKAAPYTAVVPGTLTISCETDGITLSDTEVSLAQGEWTNAEIILTGKGNVSLRIKETSGLKRFFMDEVSAVPASLSAIQNVDNAAETARNKGVYSLDGTYLGNDIGSLKKGIYIVNGKKYIIK